MEDTNNTGKIVGALLLGAAVGGALGIFFAPNKGSKTRKKISGKADDFTNGLKEKFNTFLEEAKSQFESEKDKAIAFVEKGKDK